MSRRVVFFLLLLLVTAGALIFRLPSLGNRPFHADESVHAVKFWELREKGVYRYDPNEFHGPTLYYAALPVAILRGRHTFAAMQESDFRLVTVIFGAGMLLFLALLTDGIGRRAALVAAVLLAVSPAFVFYSRYYIQEALLACFTLGWLACGWRYGRDRKPGWLAASGLCAGLMIATKETAVLAFVAAGIALWLTVRVQRRFTEQPLDLRPLWNRKHVAMALAVGLIAACLFLSGFLTNLRGPFDYLRAYTPWLHRAGTTGLHKHPLGYYVRLLLWTPQSGGAVWNEAFIVGLAFVGIAAAFTKKLLLPEASGGFTRFLAFYTLILTAIYSLIPYKTPWCVLSFLQGFILLAGVGAVVLVRLAKNKGLKTFVVALLVLGMQQLASQASRLSYVLEADTRNPYVYAQTDPKYGELVQRIQDLGTYTPQHEQTVIKVFSSDGYYWPLPWSLRRFPNIGYWTGSLPPDVNAPIVIASPEFEEGLTKRLDATHVMTKIYVLRPQVFMEVWVRMDVWKIYLETRPPEKEEDTP